MKRCSICSRLGHNKRRHRKPKAYAHHGYGTQNGDYRSNRALGLCDACGRKSKASRCKRCAALRARQPSRTAAYRRERERRSSGQRRRS